MPEGGSGVARASRSGLLEHELAPEANLGADWPKSRLYRLPEVPRGGLRVASRGFYGALNACFPKLLR
eukprot:5092993-Alexandrium_andersonii.AAC.1